MSRILIAEDEERIVSFLTRGLTSAGYTVQSVGDGRSAADLARDNDFDLMVLDLGLPGIDGHEVLSRIRGRGERLPVIVLTARDGIDDTIASFDSGADDYMSKPFRFEELLARVRTRLRTVDAPESTRLRVGAIELDIRTRRAQVNGRSIDLTAREFTLAETLMRHPGQVMSREQLLDRVWGYDFSPESNVVDVYVRYLRRKLGPDAIETVRGMGYRLVPVGPGIDTVAPTT